MAARNLSDNTAPAKTREQILSEATRKLNWATFRLRHMQAPNFKPGKEA